MGIKMKEILPEGAVPVMRDMMRCSNHELLLSTINDNACFLFDWTKDIWEAICEIVLEDGCTCILTGMKTNPGLTFKRESGDVIGFAPLRDDLTGIRDDIEYPFLDVESGIEMNDLSSAGTMQRLSLMCD